jgi:hypothetical protein
MRCIRPLKASFSREGTLTFSQKQADPGLVPIGFNCGKCLACHLNRAREKGIRAWHESKYHEDSMFLTLTYDENNLESDLLIPKHHQDFVKRLRKSLNHPISVVVTGEYGTLTKRPHWHYLIFGYRPKDCVRWRNTDFGPTFKSDTISKLWDKGVHEIGSITIESAGYVARYGAKSLSEKNPLFKPFHRTGSKRALGRSWIEDNFKHTLENGFIVLPDGSQGKIPRYYIDWSKKFQPTLWRHYVTNLRPSLILKAEEKERKEELAFFSSLINFNFSNGCYPLNRKAIEYKILKLKFKELSKNWSL